MTTSHHILLSHDLLKTRQPNLGDEQALRCCVTGIDEEGRQNVVIKPWRGSADDGQNNASL